MGRAVPAVSRALDILELFLDRSSLSAPDITERLGLPRTTVHELITTLVDRSYLIPVSGQPTRYRLGLRLFQLGSVFADQLDLAHEGREVALKVAAECDETVQVAVLDGTDVVYVAKVDSTHPVRMVSAVGRRLPAHCTGLGKMLLSELSEEALDARYPRDRDLPGMTPNSITSPARLRTRLTEVRELGLAYDDCESNEAVRCVAAPVYDHTGAMVAAMSISVPTLRWNDDRRREWGELVRRGAMGLSGRLGHRSGGDRS
ncbi:IclR family transcriptional regulator [Actinomadura sp. HBU206391]|uniref:IclR family transcriptional regulator n=1 Tax=Actinomadura sp. HBU206391 TaxID=2731692 RepID=UPI00164F16CF|nr:IclR family transcriptional regulator [Actinomadura sp. HBU206391]MBC6459704.1 IclR family transcriptional regulator [Actinomadura sp. HBU206391]